MPLLVLCLLVIDQQRRRALGAVATISRSHFGRPRIRICIYTAHLYLLRKKLATWKAINNLVLLYFHYLFIHRILPHCQPHDAWHTLKTLLLSPLSNQPAVCNNQLLLSSINCFNNAKTLCTLWTACLGMRVDTNLNVFRKPVFALPVWVTIHKKDCSCTMFALYCVTIQNKNLCACPALHTTALPDLA